MQLIPAHTNIDFIGKSRLCAWISGTLVALSIVGWLTMGFKLGIDFTGGTQLQIKVPETAQGNVDEGRVRSGLARTGIKEAEVTRIGSASEHEFLVRFQLSEEEARAQRNAATDAPDAQGSGAPAEMTPSSATPGAEKSPQTAQATPAPDASGAKEEPAAAGSAAAEKPAGAEADASNPMSGLVGQIQNAFTQEFGAPVEFKRIESIGPRVGSEITTSAIVSVAITSALILFYIWFRFDLVYAPGAVIALLHDVIVTAGVFVWFRLEVDQQVVAALLVVLGYSNNDTVVIYDRIRENVATRGKTLIADVVNESVNQTLSRTVLTHGFTSIMVLSLLIFGGPVLRGMSIALFVGINFGTYSSVYVASSLLVWLERRMAVRSTARERIA